ncbi:hypothetical protein V5F38_19125 [Xanthobacter sp. V0B-10]|uniref:hypothetical protein n=1 Tax=Xanthobacter albus TaxID=3119929 RepID=UPI00372C8517
MEDIPTHLENGRPLMTWDGWSPRDCLNLDRPDGLDRAPPPGWYSIPHWAALTEWRIFDTFCAGMPEVISEWIGLPGGVAAGGSAKFDGQEQGKALELMRQEGMAPIEWPAPHRMHAELGITTVLLFPDPILRAIFD